MSKFHIGTIEISRDSLPLVIPEIGINHGGSLGVAFAMVDAAYRASARLIKHQTHIVEDEMSYLAKKVIPGNSASSIYDVIAHCALSEDEEKELFHYVSSKNMLYLSTPFSRAGADRLEKFGVEGYKIGSGELNNYPLLEHIARFRKPMIVSTGMNGMDAIKKAINIIERADAPYALMHTTSLYPTPPQLVRLGAMVEMMDYFPGTPIGLSDHTMNNNACIAALGLGACIVERHFTDHRNRMGNDMICSMDEDELSQLLQAAREVYLMRGGKKEALVEEQVTTDFAFATVVTLTNVKAGDLFTRNNLWVKRPGIGELKAEEYDSILGNIAACDINKDTHINRSMIRVKS